MFKVYSIYHEFDHGNIFLKLKLVSSNQILYNKVYVVDSPVFRISSVINAAEFSKTTATDPNTYTDT